MTSPSPTADSILTAKCGYLYVAQLNAEATKFKVGRTIDIAKRESSARTFSCDYAPHIVHKQKIYNTVKQEARLLKLLSPYLLRTETFRVGREVAGCTLSDIVSILDMFGMEEEVYWEALASKGAFLRNNTVIDTNHVEYVLGRAGITETDFVLAKVLDIRVPKHTCSLRAGAALLLGSDEGWDRKLSTEIIKLGFDLHLHSKSLRFTAAARNLKFKDVEDYELWQKILTDYSKIQFSMDKGWCLVP